MLPALFLLGGCDAWPTVLENGSKRPIDFQYHEISHEDWSAKFSLEAGISQRLALEHWVQDISDIRVYDGASAYNFDHAALTTVRRACESSFLGRVFKFAPDCYVTYHGHGRLSASFNPPSGLTFKKYGDGS